jgi:type IV pilus assembly protein PilO
MAKRMIAALWRVNKVVPILIVLLVVVNLVVLGAARLSVAPTVQALERALFEDLSQARRPASLGSELSVFRKGEDDLAEFRGAIPGKNDFTSFLAELFSLSSAAGISIDRISYAPREDDWDLLRYTLSFSVHGSYAQLKKFIHSLEASARLIAIEEVSLSGAERQEGGGAPVSLSVRLSTYFCGGER